MITFQKLRRDKQFNLKCNIHLNHYPILEGTMVLPDQLKPHPGQFTTRGLFLRRDILHCLVSVEKEYFRFEELHPENISLRELFDVLKLKSNREGLITNLYHIPGVIYTNRRGIPRFHLDPEYCGVNHAWKQPRSELIAHIYGQLSIGAEGLDEWRQLQPILQIVLGCLQDLDGQESGGLSRRVALIDYFALHYVISCDFKIVWEDTQPSRVIVIARSQSKVSRVALV